MKDKANLMTFDLYISFKQFELKSGLIDLKVFLNVNSSIANSIQSICSFSHYVNFAETIVDGFRIYGRINSVFNHKRFINSLRFVQNKHQTIWSGHFTYRDAVDSFIFYAPEFELIKSNN